MTFGEAVEKARLRRGVGRAKLAARAGVSPGTILRVERGRTAKSYQGNQLLIIGALRSFGAFTDEEAKALGHDPSVVDAMWSTKGPFYEQPAGATPPPELAGFVAAMKGISPAQLRLLTVLKKLEGFIDPARVAEAMEHLLQAMTPNPDAGTSRAAPMAANLLSLRTPPVQKSGYVEEVVRHFEKRPDVEPAQQRTKKASKRG